MAIRVITYLFGLLTISPGSKPQLHILQGQVVDSAWCQWLTDMGCPQLVFVFSHCPVNNYHLASKHKTLVEPLIAFIDP